LLYKRIRAFDKKMAHNKRNARLNKAWELSCSKLSPRGTLKLQGTNRAINIQSDTLNKLNFVLPIIISRIRSEYSNGLIVLASF
jgi:hypothetical protein